MYSISMGARDVFCVLLPRGDPHIREGRKTSGCCWPAWALVIVFFCFVLFSPGGVAFGAARDAISP